MSEQRGSPTLAGSTGAVRSHPVFARVYERVAEIGERRGGAEHRRRLLAGLTGRVVEVGAGSGANFAHYPATVAEVIAVEPEPYLRERAQHAAVQSPVSISVSNGGADCLPGEDGSFDAGVCALVLCTVPDQQRALAELYRVIRSGGELRFYEHVIAHPKWESRFQRLADATFWPHIAGGCHLSRDTTSGIERAGFVIEACERFPFSPAPYLPPDPHILGTARRP
ncbi:MAG TPA: class I SAM-dependent methyltransferase [Solirubrobacteraceae bacterium]|nr:class I SAM-dependent methyltransferase [Solirubrobacteraceae bacterium]